MRAGIYCIENKIDGKKYIGQGINIKNRMFADHYRCPIIYNAIKKYGKRFFNRYIVIYCETKELDHYEIACIKIFHSHVSDGGYNVSWGGDASMRGRKHSKKTIQKMLGRHHTKEAKQKISKAMAGEKNPMFGKHHTDEARKRMSNATSGKKNHNFKKPMLNGQKEKISKTLMGHKGHMLGKHLSDKAKQKISKARLKYWKKKKSNRIEPN